MDYAYWLVIVSSLSILIVVGGFWLMAGCFIVYVISVSQIKSRHASINKLVNEADILASAKVDILTCKKKWITSKLIFLIKWFLLFFVIAVIMAILDIKEKREAVALLFTVIDVV